ncbi:MAG: hypothetical protein GY723_22195 [bacterium]|nr:hypothetical protein [bacterium]MCP5070467.1 hypothetical protein [bacterium]
MIVHHENRWIYIGIPRTGSTALHAYLQESGGEVIGGQHDVTVPDEFRTYSIFATVMNPFRRATSLYYLFRRDTEKDAEWVREFAAGAADSFERFVGSVLECPTLINPVYQCTISGWLERGSLGPEVTLVPIERVSERLVELGVLAAGVQVPVRNRSRLGSWEEQYDDRVEARVAAWAEADLELLDYPSRIEHEDAGETRRGLRGLLSWRRRA